MATKSTGSKSTKTAQAAKAKTAAAPQAQEAPVVNETPEKPIVPKDIDQHMIVTVRNGFQGTLVYVSRKTGERFVWDAFGDEQDMEIGELRNARNSNKAFFVNNWFMFDEPWIVDYIGMAQYYKFAVSIDDFDDIFENSPEELADVVSSLSAGQKRSVAYRARQKIRDGSIDSNRKIAVLEQCLGTSLVERD